MDRSRYAGFVGARDAISAVPLDPLAAEVLSDLAEGLLLARDEDEADQARQQSADGLGLLVERGVLTRLAAGRFWMHLRACGPRMHWPPSWDQAPPSRPDWALRGQLRDR